MSYYASTRCDDCGLNLLMEWVACDAKSGYHRAFCPQCGEARYAYLAWRL